MNQEELEKLGCKKIHWNPNYNGGYLEWYLPLTGDGRGMGDTRLSVTFNEYPEYPFLVWLVTPFEKIALEGVKTVGQFKTAYEFISGESLQLNPNVPRP